MIFVKCRNAYFKHSFRVTDSLIPMLMPKPYQKPCILFNQHCVCDDGDNWLLDTLLTPIYTEPALEFQMK